jgi:hypothetical protein
MKNAAALQLCYRIAVSTVLLGFSSAQTPDSIRPPGGALRGQVMIPSLEKINDPKIWQVVNRRAELREENGRKFVRFGKGIGEGAYWLVGSDFNEGEIEVDLRGKNIRGESFVGISFRGVDDHKFDTVYFRPFNFQDAERRNHSVQYISSPDFRWQKLREETPGKYEAAIDPAPEPEDWFHARIVVESRTVSVFVNGSLKPALVVKELSDRKGGMIGLGGTNADYANLKIITNQ